MKKIYILATVLLAAITTKAQTTVTFDDLTLAKVDTFYNGSDLAGKFSSSGVEFTNAYDTSYGGFWASGFAYSNMRNDTTAGFTNMFSAYPAEGANGSSIYAVNTAGDSIIFPTNVDLISADFTNTTYAFLSMRDGDAFAKKFGSKKDAGGTIDGTDGEDYFYIRIVASDASGNLIDSIDFYLADFRFPDSTKDYILSDWTTADLSGLKGVKYLTFTYFSSDIGTYGVNTPKYFALDDLKFNVNTTAISEEKDSKLTVYPNPATDLIHINGANGMFTIFNSYGQEKLTFDSSFQKSIDVSSFESGVYFIKSHKTANTQKIIIH